MTRDLPARPSGPTTLSSLAHSGAVAAPRSRLGLIVGVSAVVVGGAIGSALALRMAPASASPRGRSSTEASAVSPRTAAQVPATPGAAPPAGTSAAALRAGTQTAAVAPGAVSSSGSPPAAPPAASGTPPAEDPSAAAAPTAAASRAAAPSSPEARAALVAQIQDTLRRFVAWSHAHPGARCPDAAALGAGLDPWGQPLQIVCSDQPADQVAGVLSYGPDGEPGTPDDVVSWALGADVTDLARGPRWSASRGMAASGGGRHGGARPTPRTNPGSPPSRPPAAGAGSNDTDGDGIPDRR